MEPGFHLSGSGIDPERLEEELSRRVAQRRSSGAFSPELEAHLEERLPDEDDAMSLAPLPALDYAATRAMSAWEVTAAYPVDTDNPRFRSLIIYAKRLLRLWARLAVGPIQREQTAYNRHVSAALDALRRQAIAERAERLAAEEDLGALCESLLEDGEAEAQAEGIAACLGNPKGLLVVGPCPPSVIRGLEKRGISAYRVSACSTWDGLPAGSGYTFSAPIAFLSQVAEGTLEAVLVYGLAFWLKPEKLIAIARRCYLALEGGGRAIIAVPSCAWGAPAPAWCAPPAVEKALELAGFSDITLTAAGEAGGPGTFLMNGRKP